MSGWLDSPELAAVLAQARKKLERNWLRVEGAVAVSRTPDTPDLHKFAAALRGSSRQPNPTAASISVDLAALDEWLRRGPNGGKSLLEHLAPLTNRKLAEAEKQAYTEHTRRRVTAILSCDRHSEWTAWLENGSFTRYSTSDTLLRAAKVLNALPADGITRSELAVRTTGNTKALSDGPIEGLVLRALAIESGETFPATTDGRAALWDSYGVVSDSLSSVVRVLGLRVHDDHLTGRWLNEAAEAGVPFVLTLDQLQKYPLHPLSRPWYVCENPAVMTAAERELGHRGAILVCTSGQPSAAARLLLRSAPGPIHWRGDFDWTGLRTTARSIADYGATPWRMDTHTYISALQLGESEPFKSDDSPAESPWDMDLAAAMTEQGRAVMEELIIPLLLSDLRDG